MDFVLFTAMDMTQTGANENRIFTVPQFCLDAFTADVENASP